MTVAMHVVGDTNVIVSVSREPATPPNDKLTLAVASQRLVVVVDDGTGIVSEWERTASRDVVRQLIVHWHSYKGFRMATPSKLAERVRKGLADLGFKDTVDKLILRTAVATEDKRVVSNDPDFWDPKNRGRRGDADAPVAKLCRRDLGIVVTTLQALVTELG